MDAEMTGHDPRNHVGRLFEAEAASRYGLLAMRCKVIQFLGSRPLPSRAKLLQEINEAHNRALRDLVDNAALAALPMFHVEQPPDPPKAA